MSRKRLHLLIHWIPAMIGVLVIVVESTGKMSSDNTSRWLLPLWIKLFGPITPERWSIVHHWIRKTGHFLGYGCVSLCFFEGWRATFSEKVQNHRRILARAATLAIVSTLVLASWDEWHQSFLPGRTSAVSDVGIDVSGAVVAHLLLLLGLVIVSRVRAARLKTSSPQVSSQV